MVERKNIKPILTRFSDDDFNKRSERAIQDDLDEFLSNMPWYMLKKLREEYRAGQSQIASEIGVSVPQYSKYENGHVIPKLEVALGIASFFGKKGLTDLQVALHDELERVQQQAKQVHHVKADPVSFKFHASAKATVDRKRIPLYSIVDTPRVFSIEQTVQIIPDEAELITTPPMLAGIEDAYAMVVPNHHMHPAYGEGDTVFVHTGRIPANGNDVVVRLTFEDREIAFIRSIWDTNARDSKEGEQVFFDLISYAQRDVAKMHAAAQVGDPNDLGAIIEIAAQRVKSNLWTLTGFKDGRNVIAGTGLALPKIIDATVDVIVGCQRKMGSEYGRGKFSEGPFGG